MAFPLDEMDNLQLQERDEENSWNTRSKQHSHTDVDDSSDDPEQQPSSSSRHNDPTFVDEDDKEAALRFELKSVQDINSVIEGVIDSLDRAKENMGSVSRTVSSATTLLDTWTRILSQTEHNRRLILNPSWQGATQDIMDMENESRQRQKEAEQKELELQQRKQALARKAEEAERKKAAETTASTRGRRGVGRTSGRVLGRNPSVSSRTQTGRPVVRGTTTSRRAEAATRRPVSEAGRVSGIARGRGRVRGP